MNGMALMCANFGADLINISKVTSCKTKWSPFSAYQLAYNRPIDYLMGLMLSCLLRIFDL